MGGPPGEPPQAYRSEKRFNDVMNVGAKTLTDADIDNPDAWCASIKIAAKPGK